MSEFSITVSFSRSALWNYTDAFLLQLFHVCQANPAETGDVVATAAAEAVKDEIVRRWLQKAPIEQFNHRSRNLRSIEARGAV